MLQSIELSAEIGWDWWTAVTLSVLADRAISLGRWDDAERWARDALRGAHAVGERQFLIFGLAELARVAAHLGCAERAGALWGAVETEEARGPVGQWERERQEYTAAVLAAAGPSFERGRLHGRALLLDEAVEYALADT